MKFKATQTQTSKATPWTCFKVFEEERANELESFEAPEH